MRTRIALYVVALALVAAACGSSDDGTGIASADQLVAATGETGGGAGDVASLDGATTTVSDQGEVDAEEALLAFTECMRDQGVDMSDPEVDADGNLRLNFRELVSGDIDRETMLAARDACSGLLEGVAQRFDQEDRTAIEDQLLSFAACMRDEGIDMPDPQFGAGPGAGGGDPGGGPFGQLDPDDPEFQAALEVCQAEFGDFRLRPGGGGGFGGGRGPAPGGDGGGG
jgi:hypothetical protein